MTIHLTPEQERRIQAVISRGAYESVEEVVEAALTAVEQLTVRGFAGTQQELDTLLAEGLASKQLAEDEFWSSVGKQTDAMLAEHKTGPRRYDKSSGHYRAASPSWAATRSASPRKTLYATFLSFCMPIKSSSA
jgi:Arc/MetJ-type ribon-helix-helix transcriptional regulator